jgi:CRP/FNR family transcriptional regulator, cyclic AMP receptor protein
MLSENEFRHSSIVAPSLVAMDFRDEAILYSQGNRLAHLFWLLKGVVKLSHLTEQGAALTIAVLGPGDAFGTTLPNEVSEHSATALGDIRVARITHEDVTSLVGASPAFAAFLCAKLGAWRKLVNILTKTVEARLVETLCELALIFGVPCPHGYALEIRLTQQDIADLIYASRPVVTKVMNALRRRGALDYRRELICVNHSALQLMAEPKPVDL